MTFFWSVLLFLVGVVEFAIDQYEKMVSVRLKFFQTIYFGLLNQYFDFIMNIFLFGILISFWENWHSGIHDYAKLLMYFAYINGRVIGTALATWVYARRKKKKDHEHTLRLISKTDKKGKKRSKKKYNKMVDDAVTKMSNETLLDSVETEDLKNEIKERVVENVSQKISEKVDEALNQETNS